MTTSPRADRSATPPADRSATPEPDRSADRSGGPLPPAGPPPVSWPLYIALAFVFAVWLGGAWWSFREQTALAEAAAFHVPQVLPLSFDGFAIAMACVAFAASLDGRAAVYARFGVGVGILLSAGANATWAWIRSAADPVTVAIAVVVPVAAMVAFEVLLAELRKQVQRKRGLPATQPLPLPRLARVLLAPFSTLWEWRREVLERTAPARQFAALDQAARTGPETGQGTGPRTASRTGPRTGRRTGRKTSSDRSTDRPADRSTDRGATVTPIQSADRKRTGRRTGPSETAIANAMEVLDRWPDRVPSRADVMDAFGWGAERAGNAIKALKAARERRAARATGSDDDEERASWAG